MLGSNVQFTNVSPTKCPKPPIHEYIGRLFGRSELSEVCVYKRSTEGTSWGTATSDSYRLVSFPDALIGLGIRRRNVNSVDKGVFAPSL